MKRFIYPLIFLVILNSCVTRTNMENLQSPSIYSVYDDKVIQGPFEAVALSPTQITSNYQSPANESYSRLLQFKFSINGKDNELPYGVNHSLLMYPENGKIEAPLIIFGQPDKENPQAPENDFLEPNTQVRIRVDMRQVLKDFKEKGYYQAWNGNKLAASDFKGLYIAGGSDPLSWDFENLPSRPQFELKDLNGDGIFEITLDLNVYNPENYTATEWKLQKDISGFPSFKSDKLLIDALYNMSVEEMLLCIRPDSTFMAGAKWEGVWTRDISYSILLSLALLEPEVTVKSLLKKTANGKIIQDTGTGGSWPASSDRMTWSLAAWEVYKVTGDQDWLNQAFNLIKNSAEDDLKSVVYHQTGLFMGESSFLDWREQTYPKWMEPIDIYNSQTLGTNAVHYMTYQILVEMGTLLGEDVEKYRAIANKIKEAINTHLWVEKRGYYGQFLYGKNHMSLSDRAEALGEALCVLFDIANEERQAKVVKNTPVMNFGIPSIYPQIPGIPPYHNDGVWPFVQAYWNLACAKVHNEESLTQGINSLYRAAALFLTNKENMVAENGDFKGTQINSDRQLWSVAGNLAMIFKVYFGMDFQPNHLEIKPVVPKKFAGKKTLEHFTYRNAKLNIHLEGYGTEIKSITLDGNLLEKAIIPADLTGEHELIITLANNEFQNKGMNLTPGHYSLDMPKAKISADTLSWEPVEGAIAYEVVRNGKSIKTLTETSMVISENEDYAEYQIKAFDSQGFESFLSKPITWINNEGTYLVEAENFGKASNQKLSDYTGKGFIEINKALNSKIVFDFKVDEPGEYWVDFRYANGSGPVNTDNKCAIRTLWLQDKEVGIVVMPQRGAGEWSNWGYSNAYRLRLGAGNHKISLTYEPYNENMNGKINKAMLDHLRLIRIKKVNLAELGNK
jgi:uncharacterized protein YegP (UPF0339 family)